MGQKLATNMQRHLNETFSTSLCSLLSPVPKSFFSKIQPTQEDSHICTSSLPAPERLQELMAMPSIAPEQQVEHGWNPKDASPSIVVSQSHLTFSRRPTPQTTDGIRSKMGYSSGIHIWEITWPAMKRGTHAVVGVATKNMPLQAEGYQALLGSDQHSWGLDLDRGLLYHNTSNICSPASRRYPTDERPGSQEASLVPFPDCFLMVLDFDAGTLGYALKNGRYLGVAFQGLKGMTLYPSVSAVWGNCEVSLRYRNGLQPQPSSLQQLCRLSVRSALGPSRLDGVSALPLPLAMKKYVLYQ
ncbi:SPRY domain-containing SOCS box protein 2-like [Polypterus senegalus]|uniref:SPRY domain-containing SOCS box protein 2-like n=1 Tax=Polypterus senegalus TaxID=55291 RepID=UPI0019638712|nr:SPRY domain-containing SOCS box protein 2-like [Polypterus senegalus]